MTLPWYSKAQLQERAAGIAGATLINIADVAGLAGVTTVQAALEQLAARSGGLASDTQPGSSRLSTAPADAADPVAVGDNDTRMSNARAPTAHKATHEPGGSDALSNLTDASVAAANKDGTANVPSLRTLGTGASQAAAGNDTRLTDTRTPTDGSVTVAKHAANRGPWIRVADSASRLALGAVRQGQLVYQADSGAYYKSTSPDGTDAGSATWVDVAAAAAAATESAAGIVRLATDAETQAGTSRALAIDPAGLAARLTSEAVIAPTLINGWTNFSGFSTTAYYKDSTGRVHLRGSLAGGTLNAAAFVLPAGYRPTADTVFVGAGNSSANVARIVLRSTGAVELQGANNSFIGISGISFRSEA